ncbi:MAG: preprotein translocase subunit SecE [Ruminococcaceae bacterium]|nr:preprotein translocase subunit SecE [Oscillospiraceae bacterium]
MAAAAEKMNLFQRMGKYFKGVWVELKKVIWPSFSTVRKDTTIVLLTIIIVGIFLAILDWVFGLGLKALLGLA